MWQLECTSRTTFPYGHSILDLCGRTIRRRTPCSNCCANTLHRQLGKNPNWVIHSCRYIGIKPWWPRIIQRCAWGFRKSCWRCPFCWLIPFPQWTNGPNDPCWIAPGMPCAPCFLHKLFSNLFTSSFSQLSGTSTGLFCLQSSCYHLTFLFSIRSII